MEKIKGNSTEQKKKYTQVLQIPAKEKKIKEFMKIKQEREREKKGQDSHRMMLTKKEKNIVYILYMYLYI